MVKIQCQIHVTDYDGFLLRPNNNKKIPSHVPANQKTFINSFICENAYLPRSKGHHFYIKLTV